MVRLNKLLYDELVALLEWLQITILWLREDTLLFYSSYLLHDPWLSAGAGDFSIDIVTFCVSFGQLDCPFTMDK